MSADRPGVAGPPVTFDPARVDLYALFLDACARFADEPAVLDGDTSHTYRDVERAAGGLRDRLLHAGECVYVCVERGTAELVAVLAILAAGASYVAMRQDSPTPVLASQVGTVRGRVAVRDDHPRNVDLVERIRATPTGLAGVVRVHEAGPVRPGGRPPTANRDAGEAVAYVGYTSPRARRRRAPALRGPVLRAAALRLGARLPDDPVRPGRHRAQGAARIADPPGLGDHRADRVAATAMVYCSQK